MKTFYIRVVSLREQETVDIEEYTVEDDFYEEAVRIQTIPTVGFDKELTTKEEYDELKATG